jgi:hypothetical protein
MRNKSKIKTLRKKFIRVVWKLVNTANNKNLRIFSRTEYPFKGIKVINDNPVIKKSLEGCNNFIQHEYVVKLPFKSLIEPKYGWIIKDFNKIFDDSLAYGTLDIAPSFKNLIKTRTIRREKIKKIKSAISLRDAAEASYFHFYNDFLNKIILLNDLGIDTDLPLIISAELNNKPFFQDILKRCPLKNRNWVIQNDCYIETKEIIYCKVLPHDKGHYLKLLNLLNIPKPNITMEKRIFLTRDPYKGRNIENIDRIIEIAKEYDFEIIDTENMSIGEQIDLFSRCRSLIGLHGAGLVNIIFRRGAPLSILEIFPPEHIPPHYYWLSLIFNYSYDGIMGSYREKGNKNNYTISQKKSYYLDPDTFIKKMDKLKKEGFF